MTQKRPGPQLVTPKPQPPAVHCSNAPRRIAILALPQSDLFDIAGPFEAFVRAGQIVQHQRGLPQPFYHVDLLAVGGPMIKTWLGLQLTGTQVFTNYSSSPDTLIVTGRPELGSVNMDQTYLLAWLQQQTAQVRRICSVCTGVFCLAQAGVLDGKRATTHWQYAGELAQRFPAIHVDPEPVFLRDGNTYTSAGSTAAMDLALALIEDDLGKSIAAEIAREMVLFVRRGAGQAQVSPLLALQTADREPLRELQSWIFEHLHLPLTVDDLAERVHMSPRNFARAFVKETQVTPARYLETLRLEAARRRLEETSRSLDEIAAECGFGVPERMRRSFLRNLGVPPSAYRSQVQWA